MNLQKALILGLLAVLLVCASGCAVRLVTNLAPTQTRLILTNNTTVMLGVFENGARMVDKQKRELWLPSGNTASKGYWTFKNPMRYVITVQGRCPEDGVIRNIVSQDTMFCRPGQIIGNQSRPFSVTSGQYNSEDWIINRLQPLGNPIR